MKKFNFKSLLVLVLALILVFSLVACNKDDGGSTPKTPKDSFTASDYFGELWRLTSTIGDEKVSDSDYIAISADLGVALNLKNGTTSTGAIDLGLALDAVVNRNPASNLDGSAIKLKVYDPSNSGENWTTIYYFLNKDDRNYIYFDWAGQNIKLALETDDGKQDGSHANAYLGTWLNGLMQSEYTAINEDAKYDKDTKYYTKANGTYSLANISAFADNTVYYTKNPSVYSLIKTFTDSMGPDWTLNALINGLVKTLGLDLKALLNTKEGLGGTVASALVGMLEESGIESVDDLFDGTGSLKIDTILTSGLLDSFFVASKSKDGNTYTATLDESVFSIVDLISGSLPVSNLSSLTTGAEIALTFTKANEKIDKFTISVGLAGDTTTATVGTKKVYPEVAISISNLEIKKGDANGIALAKDRKEYKDTFDWNAKLALDVDGISIVDMDSDNQETFDLTGKYTIGIDASVDLMTKDINNNKTQAYAYIAKDGDKVIEASFNKGVLTVKANDTVMLDYTDNTSKDTKQIAATKLVVEKFGKSLMKALDKVYTPATKYESAKTYYLTGTYVENTAAYNKDTKYFVKTRMGNYKQAKINAFAPNTTYYVYDKVKVEDYTKASITKFDPNCTYSTKLVEEGVMDAFEAALFAGDAYKGNFVGEWTNINIQKVVSNLIWSLLPDEEEDAAPSGDDNNKFDLANVAKAIQTAIPLIINAENQLTLKSSNIGGTVISFTKLFSDWNDVSYIYNAIEEADKDNVMSKYIIKFAKAEGLNFRNKVAATAEFDSKEVYYTYDEDDDAYAVATVTAATFESLKKDLYVGNTTTFFDAVFDSEVTIAADIDKDGVDLSVKAVVTDEISAKVSLEVGMNPYDEETFKDLKPVNDSSVSFIYTLDNNGITGTVTKPVAA